MNVILSRKGFDSSYGGGASPIMPNGDLLSIPIPSKDDEEGISYSSINYGGRSYLEIMKALNLRIPEFENCHFDPDIDKDACKRHKNWKGIFGQQGAAMTHLENCNVSVGDIFLFFGSFKRTIQKEKLEFERDYQRHIIFGFLIVNKIIRPNKDSDDSIFIDHPHYQNIDKYAPRNIVYIAGDHKDYGTFKYNEELVLTRNGFSKSNWELPIIFDPNRGTKISRHSEKDIEIRRDKIMLKSRGIGQDFVISGNKEIEEWAKKIIDKHRK